MCKRIENELSKELETRLVTHRLKCVTKIETVKCLMNTRNGSPTSPPYTLLGNVDGNMRKNEQKRAHFQQERPH